VKLVEGEFDNDQLVRARPSNHRPKYGAWYRRIKVLARFILVEVEASVNDRPMLVLWATAWFRGLGICRSQTNLLEISTSDTKRRVFFPSLLLGYYTCTLSKPPRTAGSPIFRKTGLMVNVLCDPRKPCVTLKYDYPLSAGL
jgi:hypothetical protein